MNEVQALKHRLSETLKAKQLGAALAALAQLERHEPDEPDWPRRSARLLHARNDPAGELRALRRALELQVDHGRVLDAIASCKSILELEPEDEQTLQTLDLLYMEGPRQDGSSSAQDDGLYGSDPGTTADGPLDSLLLTEVIPGARPIQIGDAAPHGVAEIPIEPGESGAMARPDDSIVDLRLEESDVVPSPPLEESDVVPSLPLEESDIVPSPPLDAAEVVASAADVAAAQAVVFPRAAATRVREAAPARARPAQTPRPTPSEQVRRHGAGTPAPRPAAPAPAPDPGESARRPSRARGASLRSELAKVPLFGDLDPASLHTLIRRARVVVLEAGEVLFREGDEARSLYVVVDGAVVPIAEGGARHRLAVLEAGAFFGEIGLLAHQPRNATIEALVETRLLAIDRRVFWELIRKEPRVARGILRFLRDRLLDRQIRTNPLFSVFARAERAALAREFRVLEVRDGTRVVEQGGAPEGLFVVLAGSLARLRREGGRKGREKELGELGPGDAFGGLPLLEGEAADASVVARGKCWLVLLGEARFRRMAERNPRLVEMLHAQADGAPSSAPRRARADRL
ncbi:MAG: cyclic nucleotide-binding domain-containing protein [Spirochaetaceae bacterium]|nr:cyclic nucleotide-binding domain-containing protein [Spirochaetaceae bacterium]